MMVHFLSTYYVPGLMQSALHSLFAINLRERMLVFLSFHRGGNSGPDR